MLTHLPKMKGGGNIDLRNKTTPVTQKIKIHGSKNIGKHLILINQ